MFTTVLAISCAAPVPTHLMNNEKFPVGTILSFKTDKVDVLDIQPKGQPRKFIILGIETKNGVKMYKIARKEYIGIGWLITERDMHGWHNNFDFEWKDRHEFWISDDFWPR